MGTRPKPTEHMATSKDEAPNRRQVAENVCDETILHTGNVGPQPSQQQQHPQQQNIQEQQQYNPQIQHHIDIGQRIVQQQQLYERTSTVHPPGSSSISSSSTGVGSADIGGSSVQHYIQQPKQIYLHIPVETTSTNIVDSSKIVPKLIRIQQDLYQKQLQQTAYDQQPGPSGLQQQTSYKKQPKSRSKSIQCEICQKFFLNITKLQAHIKSTHQHDDTASTSSDNSSMQFSCEHCNKNFSSKFKLVRHVLIHSDRRQFSCTVCERTFHRKDHLKNHIKVHSPTKKIYTCDREHCKKEYTSALSFKKHLAIHFAEEGHLDCKICSKKFDTKSEILYHLKIHAGSRTIKNPNEKKFRCDFCERKFFTRKDVRRHLVVHTGRRDFLCQFCPQRFGRKDHLVRHIKKSHSTEELNVKKESTDFDTSLIKVEQNYEMLGQKPSTSSSYSLKKEIDPNIIKIEQNYELLRSSTQAPTYFTDTSSTSKVIKTETTIIPQIYTPEHEYPSFLDTTQQTNIYPENFTTFANLNPILTSTADMLIEEHQHQPEDDIGIDLDQTARDAILEHNFNLDDSSVLHDPDLLELISENDLIMSSNDDEDSKPLPGFSQAFQNPPQKD
ncbi:zinc finger imprinted 3-like [Chrysoperla carnea]|uniref:zinc finger imprinted 3-like n=1 Tax=Chrysoperla carnea TaxID=189513 RepID=UPI001D06D2A2|nr:zinc finger imprinted 3-like [Chrysoperla carnea]